MNFIRKGVLAALFVMQFLATSLAQETTQTVNTDNTSTSTSTVNSTNASTNNSTVNSTNNNNNNNVSTSTSTNTNINRNENINSGTQTINNVNSGTMTYNNNNVNTSTSDNVNRNENINSGTQTFNNNNVNSSTSNNVNTNNNVNSGTMTYNNNNESTSTNNNTNVNQNVNSGDMTNRNINTNDINQRVIQPPPTSIAPTMMSGGNNDLCTTGTSGSVQTQIFGVSSGGTVRDMNCERLKLSKTLFDMGMKVAAVATMCQDRRVFDAMLQAGTPCPYEGAIGEKAKLAWQENPNKIPKLDEPKPDELIKKIGVGSLLGVAVYKLFGF
jgi:hypothetical protein